VDIEPRRHDKTIVAGDGGAGGGGERPLGEPELRGREEVADGLVGWARIAEAVQPQYEAPVASRHVGGGDELCGKPGRRRWIQLPKQLASLK